MENEKAKFIEATDLISEESILENIKEYKKLKDTQNAVSNKMRELKGIILRGMEFIEVKTLKNDECEASVQYPRTFDSGMLKLEDRELYDKFTTIEKKIITEEAFDRKEFQKRYPEIYEKYLLDQTPRLTVK